jgi:hypothetical protein
LLNSGNLSDQELPGLTKELLRAGSVWVDLLDTRSLPPTIADRAPRSGDETMRFVTDEGGSRNGASVT